MRAHTAASIACDAPPPIKTASGGGRPASACGARPAITRSRAATPRRAAFSRARSARAGSASTPKASAPGAARAHSMATEPDPAPMSHSVSPAHGASADRVSARTARLVIWPSWANSASGRPKARDGAAASADPSASARPSASTATATGAATSCSAKASARISRRRSRGPPSASSTHRRLAPKPCAVSQRASAPAPAPSRTRHSARAPGARTGRRPENGAACRPRQATASSRQPSRAAASENTDGAG